MNKWQAYIAAAFFIALTATLGSLFFSEVMQLPPCVLCWYQRIAMYPLVVLLGAALVFEDKRIYRYALPLSVIGAVIALYHNLLYYGVLPESVQPCIDGVSCTTKFFEWFGFITIPFLSLASFVAISVLLVILMKNDQKQPLKQQILQCVKTLLHQ
ncbi:MAG: disulfide bond formation protein B [Pseudomonadales bacterium]|nr:disulfide bond formation protein B [Candidatus Woesebacteria bacterium]MCB9801623.1 disulfide bond formation protein B [Pseudomonadales bacterium]